ncbi:hypothetical protein LTR95_019252, partial [Oleoguttula sp. CCFEE 5521]
MASDQVHDQSDDGLLFYLHRYHDHYWSIAIYPWYAGYDNGKSWARSVRQLLDSRGYTTPPSAEATMLHKLLERSERCLVHYAACTEAELQSFVTARQLRGDVHITKQTDRTSLEGLLMSADESPRFVRFADLPLELRQQIYGYYFAGSRKEQLKLWPRRRDDLGPQWGIGEAMLCHQGSVDFPPLVYCNRQLRTGVLFVFWGTFELRPAYLFAYHESSYELDPEDCAYWGPTTRNTLRLAASHGVLGCFHRLQIDFQYEWGIDDDEETCQFEVDLRQATLESCRVGYISSDEREILQN